MRGLRDTGADLTHAQTRLNAWLAYVGAAVALTGAQLIAPALPAMREAFALNQAELAWVMSIYLLPAALASIPAGMLADLVGRRLVLGSALIVFGVCGLVYPLLASSFTLFLGVRFVQGIAFAGLLPLTMTILGDIFSGHHLVAAQGRRSVAMSLGDGLLPVIGGLLVAGGWFVPWLGQAVAIPLGVAVLLRAVDPPFIRTKPAGTAEGRRLPKLLRLFRQRSILALQYAGFLRMFLKFCILTFIPLFLVDVRGLSPAFAGLALGLTALAGTAVAATTGRLARVGSPTGWVTTALAGMGAGLAGIVTLAPPWAILAFALAYGASDGLLGVFINALVTAATSTDQRASFVAATGAIRNFAKFTAPAAFGALTLVIPLTPAFLLIGGLTLLSVMAAPFLRPLQERLAGVGAG